MERRELLKMIAVLTGGTVIGGDIFLSGCNTNDNPKVNRFTKEDVALLDEIAETILPKTKTPGAKDAAVGQFITVMVNDCYTPVDQQIFHEGIKQLNNASGKRYDADFMKISPAQRHDLLTALDKEAKEYQQKKPVSAKEEGQPQKDTALKTITDVEKKETKTHYFTMMKQLTLLGFFTSKPGATEALRFVAIPGRFDGCIPYKKGDKAWA